LTRFAHDVTKQALEDSGLEVSDENCYDVGCLVGTGIGGFQTLYEGIVKFFQEGHSTVSPLLLPMMLPDSPAGKIAIDFGLRGPNMSISTACATGNNSIGEATEMIRRGAATAMIAGSSESALLSLTIASLSNMGAISKRNDDPQGASRPFAADRDGFVVGQGAGVLMLEELEYARARGARIYCEISGYSSTCDAYHITAPMESGEGAQEAMRRALKDAGLRPEDIGYINAHGTSTQLNDASETRAIKAVFGDAAYRVPISSTKSVTGHLMGSAGAIEAVFSVMALVKQFIPPTINLDTPDPECDLNYTPNVGVPAEIHHVMSNSFGFGGHNAVLVFSEYKA
jgi:3-oxoacyl-[acyl-carrier-protein] synthase II